MTSHKDDIRNDPPLPFNHSELYSNLSANIYSTTCSTTSSDIQAPITTETVRKILVDFEREFPPSQRVVKVVLGKDQYRELVNYVETNYPPPDKYPPGIEKIDRPFNSIFGIPIEVDENAHPRWQEIIYLDGSRDICGIRLPPRKETYCPT